MRVQSLDIIYEDLYNASCKIQGLICMSLSEKSIGQFSPVDIHEMQENKPVNS